MSVHFGSLFGGGAIKLEIDFSGILYRNTGNKSCASSEKWTRADHRFALFCVLLRCAFLLPACAEAGVTELSHCSA